MFGELIGMLLIGGIVATKLGATPSNVRDCFDGSDSEKNKARRDLEKTFKENATKEKERIEKEVNKRR